MYKLDCIFFLLLLASCSSSSREDEYTLKATNDCLVFQLNPQTSIFIKALFPYTDKDGKEFLTFQNEVEPEILVYDMNTLEYIKTICLEKEGDNGVGLFCGYYLDSWEQIYIPSMMRNEIIVVNSDGLILRKLPYGKTSQGKNTVPLTTLSFPYAPLFFLGSKLYIHQTPNLRLGNRTMEDSPVALILDTITNNLEELPLRFPEIMTSARIRTNTLGIELSYSQILVDDAFVFSFFFDEDIQVVSLSGELKQKVKVKSKYIDKIVVPSKQSNLSTLAKELCEIAFYGNLIYDKYRDVYYRFVYPETELGSNENYMDIWQLGRTKFSIMILNKDLEVIGETLFPENTYASNHFFIREDGLYLSTSFIKNPNFSDDELRFERIELVKSK